VKQTRWVEGVAPAVGSRGFGLKGRVAEWYSPPRASKRLAGPGRRVAPFVVRTPWLYALKSRKCSWGLLLDFVEGAGASRRPGRDVRRKRRDGRPRRGSEAYERSGWPIHLGQPCERSRNTGKSPNDMPGAPKP